MEEAIRGKFTARPRGTERDEAVPAERVPAGSRVLSRVGSPADLKALSRVELRRLCDEIREFIVDVVSQKGGHLGASLGVVELTVALEATLELPRDRIVWDTGHQAYVHKVLTGRRDDLWTIRQFGGISGFLKRDESPYDAFGAGHASTSISAALGMASARDLSGERHRVVAVLGDGAMTGGLAYEALNNAGQSGRDLLVVLNDNGMSIAPNVGAIAHYLTSVTANPHLKKLHDDALHILQKLPALGEPMQEIAKRLEGALKSVLVPGGLFQALGFSYFGPVDGHDLDMLLGLLPNVYQREGPVLLHVLTRKGKGLAPAEADLESFHGVSPFDKLTGKCTPREARGDAHLHGGLRRRDAPRGLRVPADGGDHRGHAQWNRAQRVQGASRGPVLRRGDRGGPRRVLRRRPRVRRRAAGRDDLLHLPPAGVRSDHPRRGPAAPARRIRTRPGGARRRGRADAPRHVRPFLPPLRAGPGRGCAPGRERAPDLLWTGLSHEGGPFAFRWPRDTVPLGYDPKRPPRVLPVGSWELVEEGTEAAFLAVGAMVATALDARKILADQGISVAVANCRFVKPMDLELLSSLRRIPLLLTVEENALPGGFGAGVLEALDDAKLETSGVVRLGLPDDFVTHGSRPELLDLVRLSPEHLARTVFDALRTTGR